MNSERQQGYRYREEGNAESCSLWQGIVSLVQERDPTGALGYPKRTGLVTLKRRKSVRRHTGSNQDS